MTLTRLFFLVSLIIALLALPLRAYACGEERWTVKVAQDQHVKYFYEQFRISSRQLRPAQETTIAELHRWPWPFGDRKKPPQWAAVSRSHSKAEYQIWTVTAYLTEKKNEADKDYHLILASGERTLVAEIPHPVCLGSTPEPLKSLITKARADFDKWWRRRRPGPINQRVRVTGLGMFDTLGHAKGTSPNGIELHPVIAIKFLD